jgi:hypothetical protein
MLRTAILFLTLFVSSLAHSTTLTARPDAAVVPDVTSVMGVAVTDGRGVGNIHPSTTPPQNGYNEAHTVDTFDEGSLYFRFELDAGSSVVGLRPAAQTGLAPNQHDYTIRLESDNAVRIYKNASVVQTLWSGADVTRFEQNPVFIFDVYQDPNNPAHRRVVMYYGFGTSQGSPAYTKAYEDVVTSPPADYQFSFLFGHPRAGIEFMLAEWGNITSRPPTPFSTGTGDEPAEMRSYDGLSTFTNNGRTWTRTVARASSDLTRTLDDLYTHMFTRDVIGEGHFVWQHASRDSGGDAGKKLIAGITAADSPFEIMVHELDDMDYSILTAGTTGTASLYSPSSVGAEATIPWPTSYDPLVRFEIIQITSGADKYKREVVVSTADPSAPSVWTEQHRFAELIDHVAPMRFHALAQEVSAFINDVRVDEKETDSPVINTGPAKRIQMADDIPGAGSPMNERFSVNGFRVSPNPPFILIQNGYGFTNRFGLDVDEDGSFFWTLGQDNIPEGVTAGLYIHQPGHHAYTPHINRTDDFELNVRAVVDSVDGKHYLEMHQGDVSLQRIEGIPAIEDWTRDWVFGFILDDDTTTRSVSLVAGEVGKANAHTVWIDETTGLFTNKIVGFGGHLDATLPGTGINRVTAIATYDFGTLNNVSFAPVYESGGPYESATALLLPNGVTGTAYYEFDIRYDEISGGVDHYPADSVFDTIDVIENIKISDYKAIQDDWYFSVEPGANLYAGPHNEITFGQKYSVVRLPTFDPRKVVVGRDFNSTAQGVITDTLNVKFWEETSPGVFTLRRDIPVALKTSVVRTTGPAAVGGTIFFAQGYPTVYTYDLQDAVIPGPNDTYGDLTYSLGAVPTEGTTTLSGSTLTYTTTTTQAVGTYPIEFTVSNSQYSHTGTVVAEVKVPYSVYNVGWMFNTRNKALGNPAQGTLVQGNPASHSPTNCMITPESVAAPPAIPLDVAFYNPNNFCDGSFLIDARYPDVGNSYFVMMNENSDPHVYLYESRTGFDSIVNDWEYVETTYTDPITIDVLARDVDTQPGPNALSVSQIFDPYVTSRWAPVGSAVINADNTITYTPDPTYVPTSENERVMLVYEITDGSWLRRQGRVYIKLSERLPAP